MEILRFAVVTHICIQLGKQVGHFQSLRVQRTPCTAHVVADVFAETDGLGAAVVGGIKVAGLNEAAADGNDG